MLAKWTPFPNPPTSAFAPVLNSFEGLFKDPLFSELGFTAPWAAVSSLQMPHTDIVETQSQLELKVDLPGHDPKSIQVKLEGDTLTLQSERKSQNQETGTNYLRSERTYGVFARSFVLPASVDGARCQAGCENGVLTLTLPKRKRPSPAPSKSRCAARRAELDAEGGTGGGLSKTPPCFG